MSHLCGMVAMQSREAITNALNVLNKIALTCPLHTHEEIAMIHAIKVLTKATEVKDGLKFDMDTNVCSVSDDA